MQRIPEQESISDVAVARRFDEFMRGHRFRQQEYRRLACEVLSIGIPPGGRVLDLGTGSGFLAIEVARRLRATGYQVVGLDLSMAMLELAASNLRRRSLEVQPTWLKADAKTIPFGDGQFDFVVSSDSLHHWQNPSAVFNEIARVLKGDGKYLIHDLKRPQRWVSRLVSWLIGMTIPPDFRPHYDKSIQAAYCSQDLGVILRSSHLQGWSIREDLLDITVERLDDAAVGEEGHAVQGG